MLVRSVFNERKQTNKISGLILYISAITIADQNKNI